MMQHAEVDLSLARAVIASKPSDARAVLESMMAFDRTAREHRTRLNTALVWPATTLVLVTLASAVIALFTAPALRSLPSGDIVSVSFFFVPLAVSVVLFLVLAVAVRERWSLGVLTAWQSLDAWIFSSATVALVRAGVALPAAARASAEVCSARGKSAALSLAQGLEAGAVQPEAVSPLLGALTSRLLATTVTAGAGITTLEAFSALQATTLPHEVRRDAARLSAFGLLLGAISLLASAAAFYSTYLKAIDP
ncbi:MAG: hypothetical protein QM817_30095 [Archangium sp.]